MAVPNRTPLTDFSDGQLAVLVKDGDSDAFAELTARYMSLIRYKSAPFHSAQLETDDLCQEGLVGLYNAARTYNSANGAAFKTYAGTCIANRMIMAYRSALSRKNEPLSNFVSLSDGEHSGLELPVGGWDPETLLASSEGVGQLWEKIRSVLSERELRVLRLYLSGYSYAEIAAKLAITAKAADNALQRARIKLKSRFNG
ncbi:RNA polymerase sigma-H factor [Caprobacter fermentans]|uniref:RNA polymerase sigma factor SigS n=1 Tax=Caproicibacter fermentans TaxID=2576756 RepID=A0A6N8I382_9FIRM|nr:sigma-70 family RNA polymerase sigma factor [Caproicibacter fermentans]MVB12375.1 RNA polymerase sigma-H factor [Caproicibacter fermentans]